MVSPEVHKSALLDQNLETFQIEIEVGVWPLGCSAAWWLELLRLVH
jgi:hypothetical protein